MKTAFHLNLEDWNQSELLRNIQNLIKIEAAAVNADVETVEESSRGEELVEEFSGKASFYACSNSVDGEVDELIEVEVVSTGVGKLQEEEFNCIKF